MCCYFVNFVRQASHNMLHIYYILFLLINSNVIQGNNNFFATSISLFGCIEKLLFSSIVDVLVTYLYISHSMSVTAGAFCCCCWNSSIVLYPWILWSPVVNYCYLVFKCYMLLLFCLICCDITRWKSFNSSDSHYQTAVFENLDCESRGLIECKRKPHVLYYKPPHMYKLTYTHTHTTTLCTSYYLWNKTHVTSINT